MAQLSSVTAQELAFKYRGVRAMVLGATGFIGRWTTARLLSAGASVIAVARNIDGARSAGIVSPSSHIVYADIENPSELSKLLHDQQPAVVFNLAGYGVDPRESSEDRSFAVNEGAVHTLAAFLSKMPDSGWSGARVIHTGSALEYGTAQGDLSEETVPRPTTVYGRSKLAGTLALTRICVATGLKGVTVRLFTVYGYGEHGGRLLPSLLAATGSSSPIDLTDGQQQRDFTYVEDVSDGLLRVGLEPVPPGEIVNLATGRLTSVRRFVEVAADVLGIRHERLNFGALPTRGEEMQHDPVHVHRLVALTSWRPSISIASGVERTRRIAFDVS